jgi:hypothetical protein
MLFMKESKRFVQKGESTTAVILVPLDVMGTPMQMRTGFELSDPVTIFTAAFWACGLRLRGNIYL